MIRLRKLSCQLIALFLALIAAPALAQNQWVGRENPNALKGWVDSLTRADEALKAGQWKKARRITNGVLSTMSSQIESGEKAGEVLAMGTFLRAVAHAGLEDHYDARWDWDITLALHPKLETVDFSPYGEAGEYLNDYRAHQRAKAEESKKEESDSKASAEDVQANLVRPKAIRKPYPSFPRATQIACLEGATVLRMILTEEGNFTRPEIFESPNLVQAYVALDQLRDWRFKPATLAGEPTAVVYNLKVNFGIPFCSNAIARAKNAKEDS